MVIIIEGGADGDVQIITRSGSGYVGLPSITVSSPNNGTKGELYTYFNINGRIQNIGIANSGSNYNSVPTFTIESPNSDATCIAKSNPS